MSEDIYLVNDILTERECIGLGMDILSHNIVHNENIRKSFDDVLGVCCGLSSMPKRAYNLYDGLTPLVKKITGLDNLVQSSLYGRIYMNGSVLPRHTDREGLDWTLTVPLFSTLQKKWPIYLERHDGEIVTHQNQIGSGVLFKARNLPHWRDALECSEYEFSVHIFMHWEEK